MVASRAYVKMIPRHLLAGTSELNVMAGYDRKEPAPALRAVMNLPPRSHMRSNEAPQFRNSMCALMAALAARHSSQNPYHWVPAAEVEPAA